MTVPPLPTIIGDGLSIICPWCQHYDGDTDDNFKKDNVLTCPECDRDFKYNFDKNTRCPGWIGVRSEADKKYLAWDLCREEKS